MHLPLQYDTIVSQARREAEAISSFNSLVQLNQLKEERLQRQKLEMAMAIQREREMMVVRRVDPVSMGSHILGSSQPQRGSAFIKQARPLLPPTSLLSDGIVGRANEGFLARVPHNRTSDRLENLLLQRSQALKQKKTPFVGTSMNASKLSEIRNLVATAAAGVDENEGTLTSRPSEEKVQAALRSQPQRGRKRMNLSKEERVELTKTRNREHARNTRIRKKARYTELLKSERLLELFVKTEQLESERLQCLERFLSTRENMINSPDIDVDRIGNQFDDITSPDTFGYETKGLPSVFSCEESSSIARMCHWDKQLRSKVYGSIKFSSSTFFAYEVQDGLSDIAISKNGSCYAQVDVVLYQMCKDDSPSVPPLTTETATKNQEDGMRRFVLLTILMKAQFCDAASSKLASMVWTVLEDRCDLESEE